MTEKAKKAQAFTIDYQCDTVKIRRAEARVVLAAIALCNAGRGFCYRDDRKISDQKIGQRLENAVAYLKKVRTQ